MQVLLPSPSVFTLMLSYEFIPTLTILTLFSSIFPFPTAGNWGGGSSAQSNNGSNNPQQQWNNTAQRPPTSQPDSKSHLFVIG